jgi:putative ABC transport system ATP-binding protein
MVTHEQDIASYARRNVVMRDGIILKDFQVIHRLNAVDELERIPAVDSETTA